MYPHPADNIEIRLQAGQQCRLPVQFLTRAHSNTLEGIRDGEDVQIEAAGGDTDCLVLVIQRETDAADVVMVCVGSAEI
jgi:hypothetical protein